MHDHIGIMGEPAGRLALVNRPIGRLASLEDSIARGLHNGDRNPRTPSRWRWPSVWSVGSPAAAAVEMAVAEGSTVMTARDGSRRGWSEIAGWINLGGARFPFAAGADFHEGTDVGAPGPAIERGRQGGSRVNFR
jgi:hypothetical protein